MSSLSSCFVSSAFSELRSFSLGVHCGSGSFLFSVQWGTGFYWLTASTSRAPWELVAGRRVLSCSFWPCGRQLVDGFCSLGSPFLRKENFCLSFSGDFSCLPTASQEFFLAFGNLAPSPVRVKSADGFWHSQMSLLLRKAVFVSQFGFLKLSCSPLVPFFQQGGSFSLVWSASLASAAD